MGSAAYAQTSRSAARTTRRALALFAASALWACAAATAWAQEDAVAPPSALETEGAPPESCEGAVLARFDWPAAQLAAAAVARLLQDGFACRPEPRDAGPAGVVEAFSRGDLALIAPALSLPPEGLSAWAPASGASTVSAGGPLFGAAEAAGFAAAPALLDQTPPIRTLMDLAENAERFAASPGARPQLHLCPEHWPCHAETRAAVDTLGLDAVFDIIVPASGDALTEALTEAARDRRPWIGYYWTPSDAAATTPLRVIDPGAASACDAQGDCRPLFPRPRTTIVFSAAFEAIAPRAATALRRFALPVELAHEALAWRRANNADWAATADFALSARPQIWRDALDAEARRRFETRLQARREPPADAQ